MELSAAETSMPPNATETANSTTTSTRDCYSHSQVQSTPVDKPLSIITASTEDSRELSAFTPPVKRLVASVKCSPKIGVEFSQMGVESPQLRVKSVKAPHKSLDPAPRTGGLPSEAGYFSSDSMLFENNFQFSSLIDKTELLAELNDNFIRSFNTNR